MEVDKFENKKIKILDNPGFEINISKKDHFLDTLEICNLIKITNINNLNYLNYIENYIFVIISLVIKNYDENELNRLCNLKEDVVILEEKEDQDILLDNEEIKKNQTFIQNQSGKLEIYLSDDEDVDLDDFLDSDDESDLDEYLDSDEEIEELLPSSPEISPELSPEISLKKSKSRTKTAKELIADKKKARLSKKQSRTKTAKELIADKKKARLSKIKSKKDETDGGMEGALEIRRKLQNDTNTGKDQSQTSDSSKISMKTMSPLLDRKSSSSTHPSSPIPLPPAHPPSPIPLPPTPNPPTQPIKLKSNDTPIVTKISEKPMQPNEGSVIYSGNNASIDSDTSIGEFELSEAEDEEDEADEADEEDEEDADEAGEEDADEAGEEDEEEGGLLKKTKK
jgi:hypothetical protein